MKINMKLQMVVCNNKSCTKYFFVENEEENVSHCPFCEKKETLYYTYSFIATPTMEEVVEVDEEDEGSFI